MKNIKKNLISMAKEWKCEKNQMVVSLIDQYEDQYKLVERLYQELADPETTFVDEKVDRYHGVGMVINPILKELPKFTDAANRTASLIITTIYKVGIKPVEEEEESALAKFLEDDDE